jgi:hypothetical protein
MDLERRRPADDPAHARRWRRKPFAPARVQRPGSRPDGTLRRDPRDPRPRGGSSAGGADRPD